MTTASQRRAQAQADAQRKAEIARKRSERRAIYGPFRVADVRTWFSWHWWCALIAVAAVAALPAMFGDGSVAEAIWLSALAAGLVIWGVWLAQLHRSHAPARRAAAEQVARLAAERAAYLAARQVGNAWRHGACAVNHRTQEAAARCPRG